jgi:hypothetical protein
MTSAFYKTASAVIVACDVTSQTSIANAEVWADEARHGAPVDTPLLLVATKTDIVKEKWAEDAKQQIENLSLKIDAPLFEISSLTGTNVQSVFEYMVRAALGSLRGQRLTSRERFSSSDSSMGAESRLRHSFVSPQSSQSSLTGPVRGRHSKKGSGGKDGGIKRGTLSIMAGERSGNNQEKMHHGSFDSNSSGGSRGSIQLDPSHQTQWWRSSSGPMGKAYSHCCG